MSGSDIDADLERHEVLIDNQADRIAALEWQVAMLAGTCRRLLGPNNITGLAEARTLVDAVFDDDEYVKQAVTLQLRPKEPE